MYLPFVWLAVLVGFLAFEASTVAIVCIWFAAGSLVSLILSLIWPTAFVAQIIVFLAVSILCLLLFRPFVQKYILAKRTPTNADANVGKACCVTTEIQPGIFGRVKLEGLEWTARSNYTLSVGTWCRVDAIEGVKLIVSPFPQEQQT